MEPPDITERAIQAAAELFHAWRAETARKLGLNEATVVIIALEECEALLIQAQDPKPLPS